MRASLLAAVMLAVPKKASLATYAVLVVHLAI